MFLNSLFLLCLVFLELKADYSIVILIKKSTEPEKPQIAYLIIHTNCLFLLNRIVACQKVKQSLQVMC